METKEEQGVVGSRLAVPITILPSGETFLGDSSHSILESMHRLGRRGIPVGCRSGGCSVCRIEIVEGEWQQCRPMSHAYVSDEDIEAGRVLACCVTPTRKMTLRVLGRMRRVIEQPTAA
ncbi:MAG: 2Fe-2S iron-sulfur cluster-binding protein [Alphaproteobacteria bacterium]|nr:2Fe-2S iron-sulfur cluster-binding protein [Alphaproteobacteria bacterium]